MWSFFQQTVEKSLFMKHFYKHSMHRLMAPLMAQTASEQVSKGMSKQGLIDFSVGVYKPLAKIIVGR